MLTYRVQKRHFKITEGTATFPNDVRVEMVLAPPTPFGGTVGGGLTVTRGSPAHSIWNASTDRHIASSDVPFPPVDVTVHGPEEHLTFTVKGTTLRLSARCQNANHLEGLILSVYHLFPALLNVSFGDPPTALQVTGEIGQAKFRWELMETRAILRITDAETQEQAIRDAWGCLTELFAEGQHRRLAAALHYFHVACRLRAAGDSPWEFMGEAVLNLTKSLQALFGQQGDDVKEGLRSLGYSDAEIAPFLTVMELRDALDSGHVMLSVMNEEQAHALYVFLYGREPRFRGLLSRAIEGTRNRTFAVQEQPDLTLDAREKKLFDWIRKANAAEAPPEGLAESTGA